MQSVKTGAGFMSTKMVTLWGGLLLSVAIRFLLSAMGSASLLGRRLEVVSPVTSLTRCMFFPRHFLLIRVFHSSIFYVFSSTQVAIVFPQCSCRYRIQSKMWVTDRIRVSDLGHNFGTSSEVKNSLSFSLKLQRRSQLCKSFKCNKVICMISVSLGGTQIERLSHFERLCCL